MYDDNDTCDKCGTTAEGIGWFAKAYRLKEQRAGRPDPGNLCGECAGAQTGPRIADEVLNTMHKICEKVPKS